MCLPGKTSLMLAAMVMMMDVSSSAAQQRRALTQLGHLDPPKYAAPLLREGESSPEFDDAMRAYALRRYDRAADGLRRFVIAEPDDSAANLFLASSLMMTDEVGEAEDRIGAVLAAGETRFEMTARFILAKAAIRTGKLDAAERELERVAASSDPLATEASSLLRQVRGVKDDW